jgi:hypothetical protein
MAIALFSRWSRLRLRQAEPVLIPADCIGRYPALSGDLTTIDDVVALVFREYDLGASAHRTVTGANR